MKRLTFIITLAVAAATVLAAATNEAAGRKARFAEKLRTFNSIVKELEVNYVDTLNANEIMDQTIASLLYQVDPYTEYYPAEDQDELLSISTGQYAGIGAVISKRGDRVIINRPNPDSPARRAGLRAGDVILRINGDTVTPDMGTDKVSRRLRGQAGTHIAIDICRPYAADSLLTVEFDRETIKINPVPYYGIDSTGVGYIRLTTFNESSGRRVRQAVEEMCADPGLKGIILDLRGNGGGLLEGAVQIASNFVDKGTEIVRTRGRDGANERVYRTTTRPVSTSVPLVVLTDGGTASASEIVAGSMQDLDRGVIVGERSFGKGLVQTSVALPYDALMKITTGRYYIPSGRLIQAIDYSQRDDDGRPVRKPDSLTNAFTTRLGRTVRDGGGITPDIRVESPESNRLLYNIMADMWAFDYVTRHVARNPQAPAGELVGDSVFADFKAFIDPARFKYDRRCESGLEALRETAKTEGYMTDSVAAQFDVLASLLRHDLGHDLDINRDAIVDILEEEMAARYFDEAGQVAYSLRRDPVYARARRLLLDPDAYRAVLSPGE